MWKAASSLMPLEQRFEVQVNQAAPWERKISVVQYDGRREVSRITTSIDGLPILGMAIGEALAKFAAAKNQA